MYNQKRSETSCLPVPASEEHFSQVLMRWTSTEEPGPEMFIQFNSIQSFIWSRYKSYI